MFGIRKNKTRVSGLSYDIVGVILCLAVLVQYWRVTDGRTDGRTDGETRDECIPSRGNKIESVRLWKAYC